MRFAAELKLETLVNMDLLEKCREIQRRHNAAFAVTGLGDGVLQDGELRLEGLTVLFDEERIDSVMELFTFLKTGTGQSD